MSEWPSSTLVHSNVSKFNILIFLSAEQLINFELSTNNKHGIQSVCALNVLTRVKFSKFQILIEPSTQPQAIWLSLIKQKI